MPRRPARSASSAGAESNSILVIFLVFFVLISLTLGVFLYLAQDKISTAEAARKKAEEAKTAVDKDLKSQESYWRPKFMMWIDPASVEESDQVAVADKEKDGAFMDSRPEKFKVLAKEMEGDGNTPGMVGPVDPGTGKPKHPVKERLKALEQQLAEANKNFATKQREYDSLKTEFSTYQKEWNGDTTAKKVKDAQNAAETQKQQALAQKEEELTDARRKITETTQNLTQELEKTRKEFAEQEKKIRAEVDTEKEKLIGLQQELRSKYSARTLVQLDKPRGRIVSVDRHAETVYINLGTAAHLPPQVTFAVYGRGPGGKVLPEPKAKIEVLRILDQSLSLARVTAMAKPSAIRAESDPDREAFWITDPKQFYRATEAILPDDLLFNPVWDPDRHIHVGLVGFFDIDGDGQDDLESLVRMLRDLGTVIDARPVMSAGTYKMVGKIDHQTDYLIVGKEMPAGVKPASPEDQPAKFESDALNRGIEILRLQRFLDKVGYSTIRVPVPKTAPPSGNNPIGAPPGAKEEGKKDEGK
jgi:hypothetical protein